MKEIVFTIMLVIQGHLGQPADPATPVSPSEHEEAFAAYENAVHDREFWKALHYAGKAYNRAREADLPAREMARYASAFGNARAETGGLHDARDLFRECAALLAGLKVASAERAYCLLREGELTGIMGETAEGLALIDQAVRVAETGPQSWQARRVAVLARFMDIVIGDDGTEKSEEYQRAQYEKALALLPELEEVLGEGEKHAAYLHALIGRYLYAEGEYSEALDHLVPAYDGIHPHPTMAQFSWMLMQEIKTAAHWRITSRHDDALYVLYDGCATLDRNGMTRVCIERSWYPPIPPDAIAKNQYGFAELSYDIDAQGKPQNVRVLRSWPEDYFGESAAWYLGAWTFKPPVTDEGEVVEVTGLKEFFTFDPERLDDEGI
nr:TonB family protein [Aquisalinus flavus]